MQEKTFESRLKTIILDNQRIVKRIVRLLDKDSFSRSEVEGVIITVTHILNGLSKKIPKKK